MMRANNIAFMVIAVGGLLAVPGWVLGQSPAGPPPHVPLQKTIGQARPHIVPSLIVMNASGASLAGGKLTLTGIAPNAIVFADRPVRSAGHALTAHLIQEWNKGSDSFAKNPPNATVSVFARDGAGIRDAVLVLKNPALEGDRLAFDVAVLEGDLAGADGPAAVFIDTISLPFAPFSFAGVAGRTADRAAFYRWAGQTPYVANPLAEADSFTPSTAPCGYTPYPAC
jgi:hypothetical protein